LLPAVGNALAPNGSAIEGALIENLSVDIAVTQKDMEMTLKEFMETVADKLEGMEKIRKLQDKVNRK
jgi:nucleoid DNA-binding protein